MSFAHLPAVLDALADLAGRFNAAGYRLYLVGGIVRDQMIDEPLGASADIDLTTDARPDAIKKIASPVAGAMWTQGERFGTIGIKHGGHSIEITTHRAESYDSDSRKPTVAFGDSIRVDLSRRDFTVNAMAIELPDGKLVDPYGGAEDLASRHLRTPLEPEISFTDDPLRLLRAARFIARFDLGATPDLKAAATVLAPRLEIVAIERIGVELIRMLEMSDPGPGLTFLAETGVLVELARRGGLKGPVSAEQTVRAAELAGRTDGRWQDRVANMLIALVESSPPTRPRADAEIAVTVAGVAALARGLRLTTADQRTIVATTRSGLELARLGLEPPELRAWILATPDRAAAHSVAGFHTHDLDQTNQAHQAACSLAAAESLDHVEILTGGQVMATLDLNPGRQVGRAIDHLKSLIIAHGPLDLDTQRARLKDWLDS